MSDDGDTISQSLDRALCARKATALRDATETLRARVADIRDPELSFTAAILLEQRAIRILAGEPDYSTVWPSPDDVTEPSSDRLDTC